MRLVLTLAVLTPVAVSAQSAGQLSGRVLNDSGVPIANASVTLVGIGYSVRLDSLGRFALSGTPGSTLQIRIRATGFREDSASIVFPRGRPVTRDFTLTPESTPLPESNPSDRVLRGRVTDPEGGPLAYANIQINGGRRYVSDDSGRFSLPITVSGRFSLLIRRIGFQPEEVKLDALPDTMLRIRMRPLAVALPELRVTATTPFRSLDLGGFYRRMADVERGINRGYFVTPEELEARNPVQVTSAIVGLPNIRIRPSRSPIVHGGPWEMSLRVEDSQGCPLTIYLDRVKVSPVISRGALRDEFINSLIIPTTLAGIEVYPRRAGAPPDYPLVEGTCGAVLLWTK
jgi:hypothetical protein